MPRKELFRSSLRLVEGEQQMTQIQELTDFVRRIENKDTALISVLHKAKEVYGGISVEVLKLIANLMNLSLSEVSGAATFYSAFNGMSGENADDDIATVQSAMLLLNRHEKFAAVKKAVSENTDLIAVIGRAKISGRSGSGFPVAKKWSLTRDVKAHEKFIVCNGSEGEGDTYKDCALFINSPESIIEGMIICALVTGIKKGYIYIRAEYVRAFHIVEEAVKNAYEAGVLGENILNSGKSFYIEVFSGGGAYVSGEETALLQTLEGRRAEPRLKPPYPGTNGLFGCPTIINNAETFAAVASLVLHGEEQFEKYGTESVGGTKLYTVSGAVINPGVYETAHGITVLQLLERAGGAKGKIKGFQLGGGATGGFASTEKMNTVLDYAGCRKAGLSLGTAAVRFIGEEESVPFLALKSIAFLKDQSCGMCVPCRYGLAEIAEELEKLCKGNGGSVDNILQLCNYVSRNSRCALGQSSTIALTTAINAFSEEFISLERGGRING